MTPDQIVELVNLYKYWILLPFMVFEGPIATVVGGFLVSVGVLNFVFVYFLSLFGDMIGDAMWWFIGRMSRRNFLSKLLNRLGMPKERFLRLESHFEKRAFKTLFIGKFIYGFETVSLVAAGAARVPFWKFMFYTTLPSAPKSLFFLIIGYYFGSFYNTINQYLDNVALAVVIIAILALIAFVVYRFILLRATKKVARKL